MFGHLLDRPKTWTGTGLERGLRNWMRDKYERSRDYASGAYGRSRDYASDAYGSAREGMSSLGSRLPQMPHWRSPVQYEREEHHGPVADVMGALFCFALGAGAMYYFDPQYGKRRRALVRDKFYSLGRRTAHSMSYTGTHLRNRSRGVYHETLRHFRHTPASDQQLVGRVRARLGHVYPHAHGIRVSAHEGVLTLTGNVERADVEKVMSALRGVPGVNDVQCQWQVKESVGMEK